MRFQFKIPRDGTVRIVAKFAWLPITRKIFIDKNEYNETIWLERYYQQQRSYLNENKKHFHLKKLNWNVDKIYYIKKKFSEKELEQINLMLNSDLHKDYMMALAILEEKNNIAR